MKIIPNYSFHIYHTLPKLKLTKSVNATTLSQVEIAQNQSIQDNTSTQSDNSWKPVLSGSPHLSQWKLYKTIF